MFCDRPFQKTCQTLGKGAIHFARRSEEKRAIAVMEDVNKIIGMGGRDRDLLQFQLIWHYHPDKEARKVMEQRDTVEYLRNPRFALTIDDNTDTLAPSRIETRIHTPGSGQPKLRWAKLNKGRALGRGQFGVVYKCIDVDKPKIMAVKVMTKNPGARGDLEWAKLRREVEILNKISHVSNPFKTNAVVLNNPFLHQPHVVDYIFSQGWERDEALICMGLKEGNFESLVTQACAPVQDLAWTVFNHMLQALDFLSVNGIIHRDLKPANILYTTNQAGYQFQLSDFGVSNFQSVAQTIKAGSPLFMAPEVFNGGKQTSKADIWSLFVTIVWTLDSCGFRQQRHTRYDDIVQAVLLASNSADLSKGVWGGLITKLDLLRHRCLFAASVARGSPQKALFRQFKKAGHPLLSRLQFQLQF